MGIKDLNTYNGTVLSYSSREFVLGNIFDESKPPCHLTYAEPALTKYIDDLHCTDDEEKYIHADYCYDDLFNLKLISIPAGDEYNKGMRENRVLSPIPAKVITTDPQTKELVIFGQKEFLKEDNPEPMSMDEVGRLYKWMFENEYKVKPDPFIQAEEKGRKKAISDISFRMFYAGQEISDVSRLTGITKEEAAELQDTYKKNKDNIIKKLKLRQSHQR